MTTPLPSSSRTHLVGLLFACGCAGASDTPDVTFTVVDTMQSSCFDLDGETITCGSEYVGQDAEYSRNPASYTLSDDEAVVEDINTGLQWEREPSSAQYTFGEAADYCADRDTGGHADWRLPTIKELYSIADFDGSLVEDDVASSTPYLDQDYFNFEYATPMTFATQYWSSTTYDVNKVGGSPDDAGAYDAAFGFNFADGHIKAYGIDDDQPGLFIRCVRGAEDVYGVNDFSVNTDNTVVTDAATGLMWQQSDGGVTYTWPEALAMCEALELDGYDDWRLPNNKELQSIVAYGKTEVPAIDTDYFDATYDDSYGGADFDGDYGWYWSSTTLGDFPANGCYFAFGRAYSTTDDLDGDQEYHDWHGAGAQRSDPKDGELTSGESCSITACDLERGVNYARCVRG